MAVEHAPLRAAVTAALEESGARPRLLLPEELPARGIERDTLAVLNAGSDPERLIDTAAALWEAWGAAGRFDLLMRAYLPESLAADEVVFRLWSIGPELTVTVGTYLEGDAASLRAAGEEVVRFLRAVNR